MATTRLIPMHVIKGQTVAHTVHQRISYAVNPKKTNGGELVSAYGCDPATAAAEMLLCKRQYETYIGRSEEKRSDIVLYQIRQSFKPGEVTPEQAQQIGFALAERFTKGKYQFVVSTHVDHAHIHNHIIFNSTALNHTQKFRNFWGSSEAVRKISDLLCLEQELSVIENPQNSHRHYGKWLGNQKPLTHRDKLRQAIDDALAHKPQDFGAFLQLMDHAGYEYKSAKYIAFKLKDQQRFIRLRSLGDGYSDEAIQYVLAGKATHAPKRKSAFKQDPSKVNLLVDIQAKLQAGKGPGYERWAKVFNLKQMAKTLNYLTENNIADYETLAGKARAATDHYHDLSQQMKAIEKRMLEINDLKKRIVNYAKTKEVYIAYRDSGYNADFYRDHTSDIILHQATRETFETQKTKKLPSVRDLQSEFTALQRKKKHLYPSVRDAQNQMKECLSIRGNIQKITRLDQINQYSVSHNRPMS